MAWNEPSGNDQDPWGKKKKGNNQGPPDLDEAFRKLRDQFKKIFKGGNKNKRSTSSSGGGKAIPYLSVAIIACIFLIFSYLWNAIYTVDEKERAIILRFGQYVETVGPGLHLYFPGIEQKFQGRVTEYRTYNLRQQMLTKDENIVEVSMSVQYNITNFKEYILNVSQPLVSLQEATQSALRHVVGSSEMHQVLTEGRETMGTDVKLRLQKYLNSYQSGLNVRKVNVEGAQPPKEVQVAFDDVIRAREDEERSKNRAEAYANKIIPEARGKAQRTLANAHAYKSEVVDQAKGEASRFVSLLNEYNKAPIVTRERLYLSAMENILTKTSKILVDSKKGNNVFYLPLDKLIDNKKSALNQSLATQLSDSEVNNISNSSLNRSRQKSINQDINSRRSGR